MVTEVNVHHVGITVSNLERAVEWYRTAFGLAPGDCTANMNGTKPNVCFWL